MGRVRSFVSRHRAAAAVAALLFAGLVVFVLVWFQPQKLFLNKTVNEAAPSVEQMPEPTVGASSTPTPAQAPAGRFRSLEHSTSGTARIVRLADGSFVLRLESFRTSNGPDVRVYLSTVPPDRGLHDYAEGFIDLGALKGNRGNQNYAIPAGTDLTKFRSAVIWCRRFKVGFGVAPISAV